MINYTDMTKEESKRLCIKIDVLKEKLAILQKAWDKSPESVPLAEIDRCKAELRKAEHRRRSRRYRIFFLSRYGSNQERRTIP